MSVVDFLFRKRVQLLSRMETLEYLVAKPISFARFGDGEAGMLFEQKSVYFQDYHPDLAAKLNLVLTDNSSNLLVGYNNSFANSQEYPVIKSLARSEKPYARSETYLSTDDVGVLERKQEQKMYQGYLKQILKLYQKPILGDSTVFFVSFFAEEYRQGNLDHVFELIKQLFAGRRILFVCPEKPVIDTSFQELVAKKIIRSPSQTQFISIPDHNAFTVYDELLQEIVEKRTEFDAVFMQGGPTATCLVYELTKLYNILAYDVGSLNVAISKSHKVYNINY